MSWNIGDNRNVFLKLRTKLGLYHVLLTSSEQTPKKVNLTIVEMQQLPEVGKFDSENEISCLRWIIFNGRRKICVFYKSDTDYVAITVYRYRNNMYMKDSDIELKLTEYNTLLEKKKYLLSYLETFSKKFIVVEESTHHNWYYFAGRWTSSLLLLLFNLTRDWNFVPHSKKTQWGKIYFWVFVTAWIQKSPCVRWMICTLTVDLLVMVIHTWTVCYVTRKYFVYMQFCTMLLVLCIQRIGKDRVIAILLDVDQTRVCLVILQDLFFVSIWNFLYPPYSTDSTVDQNTMSYDSDNVCQITFLTM